ncbi:TetR family transcriptional regulator [Streptomyces sioyaensis]|uniref:TetR family transcriptional regulator n=1 Tax=Streptomyces sioyaensis TaxID=67364 RepID=UPI0036CEFD8E
MAGKQARSLQTYERVLDAAAVEFAQQGYPNTNLQRVAERTGLTKGALYGHFSSKEELAAALVERLDEAVRTLADTADGSQAPALEKLRSLTFSLADRLNTDIRVTAALRLVLDNARAGAEPPAVLSQLREHTVRLVGDAQREQDISPELPPGTVTDLLLAVLFGAHCTAPVAGWKELPGRVREMWDILAPALCNR